MKEPTEKEMLAVAKTLCMRPWSKQTDADKDHYMAQARYRLVCKASGRPVAYPQRFTHMAPRPVKLGSL